MTAGRARVQPPVARLAGLLLAVLVVLAGCVNVPTSGPVEKVEGQREACQNCVNVVVAPPAPGDDPKQVVEGYLRATSNYQPGYSVARQFLTRSAAEKWSPDDGVLIYSGSPVAQGSQVSFTDARLVGSLGRDRTYTARNQDFRWTFGLVKQDGEWRINTPPPGLMVAEFSFDSFYKAYDLFFLGSGLKGGNSLVPDPIYLPTVSNPSNVASALMKALLAGPSRWLKPVVSSAIPAGTGLSVDSVTITDGIAEVPLSDSVAGLSDPQRSLMAAQVVYTLKQAGGLKGVHFSVNQQSYRIPDADPSSLVVPIDATSLRELDPVPVVAGQQLYAVSGGKVKLVNGTTDAPTVSDLNGPVNQAKLGIDSLAVSVGNTDLALVTDDRTVLRRAPTSTAGQVRTLLRGVTGLLRPQFTRYGEIWAIGRQHGRQKMWLFTADSTIEVDAPVLSGHEITAFKISPDGTRLALVAKTAKGSTLAIARIARADKVIVDGWRPLDLSESSTSSPQISRIADVAWLDATELLVLGAATKDAAVGPVRVDQDASQLRTEGEPSNWNAVELAVLLGDQTAIVVGRDGQTWRDDGSSWAPFVDHVATIAYPG